MDSKKRSIKIANFKNEGNAYYHFSKIIILSLFIISVGLLGPIIHPHKFSYDLRNLISGVFLILLFSFFTLFQKNLIIIIIDIEKEEFEIQYSYLYKKSVCKKIPFQHLSYRLNETRHTELTFFYMNKKIYNISQGDLCLEKTQIEYLIKVLKENTIRMHQS